MPVSKNLQVESILRELEKYRAAPNTGYVLNTSYAQSISGTGPHFEMGGYGSGPEAFDSTLSGFETM